ncbi:hypothetical protein MLD38_026815 [Melastoma candidum]|uniref:Uncharacterized protein n=1 Tax=Melastoma candidum TaxID=119954 RepID=A0ACB9P1N3_9MYRT|nr:hypothetical protein MLD38_026815 [Melastoma candidum]
MGRRGLAVAGVEDAGESRNLKFVVALGEHDRLLLGLPGGWLLLPPVLKTHGNYGNQEDLGTSSQDTGMSERLGCRHCRFWRHRGDRLRRLILSGEELVIGLAWKNAGDDCGSMTLRGFPRPWHGPTLIGRWQGCSKEDQGLVVKWSNSPKENLPVSKISGNHGMSVVFVHRDLGEDERLGVEALRQRNAGVEYIYQMTKSFERLSFLYLLTDNTDKLTKMLKPGFRRMFLSALAARESIVIDMYFGMLHGCNIDLFIPFSVID